MRTHIGLAVIAVVLVAFAGGQADVYGRQDPTDAAAFCNRGNDWFEKKDYDKAIRDYDEAIRLNPKMAEAFFNRGNAWSDKKAYDKAIKDYDEAIRLEPKVASQFYNRGLAWSYKNEFDKAIKDYDEAIRLDPQMAPAFYNRGLAWSYKKDYDKAIENYDEAIRLKPQMADAFTNRGNIWCNKKDYNKAIKDYDEAIRLDPKDAVVHFNRSLAHMLAGQRKAGSGFQTVLELDGWKGYRAAHAVLLGHFAARQDGDEPTAKRFLTNSAGKLVADWPYPVVRFLREEIDEAALLKLASDDNQRINAHCYLGLDQALKGHKAEAMAHFRWVKEHGTVGLAEYTIAVAELERLERPEK